MFRPGFDRVDVLVVAVAGVVGATLRWAITRSSDAGDWFEYASATSAALEPALPTAVLTANVLGCLVLGALTALHGKFAVANRRFLLAASIGFCGSLTTFATFAVDTANLLGATGRPDTSTALIYLLSSVCGGGAAFAIGRLSVRRRWP